MAPLTKESIDALDRLRNYQSPPCPWNKLDLTRRAAVLILLYADAKGDLRCVLTERSSHLRTFAGQVALPGGKADTLSETPFETSRREAEEEIGLPRDNSKVPPPFTIEHLCEMPMNLSRNNLGVRPCVAFLKNTATNSTSAEETLIPRLNPREVASVFTAPFAPFLLEHYNPPEDSNQPATGSIDEENNDWYTGQWVDWYTSRWKMHEFSVPSRPAVARSNSVASTHQGAAEGVWHDAKIVRYRVFGMTARIMVDAARVAYDRDPEFEFVEHFGDVEVIEYLQSEGRLGPRKRGQEEGSAREELIKEGKNPVTPGKL